MSYEEEDTCGAPCGTSLGTTSKTNSESVEAEEETSLGEFKDECGAPGGTSLKKKLKRFARSTSTGISKQV
jgi:hypothetical protein